MASLSEHLSQDLEAQEPSNLLSTQCGEATNTNNEGPGIRPPKIRMVEEGIYSVGEHVYLPCHVAIGLCNSIFRQPSQSNNGWRDMCKDAEKERCLNDLLFCEDHVLWIRGMANELRGIMETMAKGFYGGLDEKSKDFLEMLVLDGSYILNLFLKFNTIRSWNVAIPVTKNKWQDFLRTGADARVVRDVLYVFQNQIPFVVLETLYSNLVGPEKAEKLLLRRLMVEWVRGELKWHNFINPSKEAEESLFDDGGTSRWEHLLELVHRIITRSGLPRQLETKPCDDRETTKWHRATLYGGCAAVSLVDRPLDGVHSCSILDVNLGWSGGSLQIPPLNLDNDTLTMLLNLMVLEKYDQGLGGGIEAGNKKHVTSYCFFLSRIAREVQDVVLLGRRLILENNLPDDTVAAARISKITSGFCPNLPSGNYLHKTAQALDSRLHSRFYQTIAWLMLNNLKNPAMAALSIGGLAIFIFTIVQATFAIKSYRRGH